jgi:hypothetical protein
MGRVLEQVDSCAFGLYCSLIDFDSAVGDHATSHLLSLDWRTISVTEEINASLKFGAAEAMGLRLIINTRKDSQLNNLTLSL